jgi:heterodisulfide reductase subunit B
MREYAYYPGCSVKGTARAYEESLLAVLGALDVRLNELDDWNCCGATAYMSIDENEAIGLAARNLALAGRTGQDLVTPCNACWLVLNKAKKRMREDPPTWNRVTRALQSIGLTDGHQVAVRHPLDVLVNDVTVETLQEKVTERLEGLKVAPYYGCQIVRPYALFDAQDDPQTMDRILEATGAEVVDFYPFKTRCCGGSQTGTLPEVGYDLIHALLKAANDRGADVIATICPLCQFNLEVSQQRIAKKYAIRPIPVVYFTQILGVALGLSPRALGLHRALVPAEAVLTRRAAHVG